MHDLVRKAKNGRDYVLKFAMWPNQWKTFALPIQTPWQCIKYRRENLKHLPDDPGVYAFVVKPEIADLCDCNYLMYIGKAERQSLKTRCGQYLGEKNKKKPRLYILEMLENWEESLFLYYTTANTASLTATDLENALLAAYLPPMNKQLPGELNRLRETIYR